MPGAQEWGLQVQHVEGKVVVTLPAPGFLSWGGVLILLGTGLSALSLWGLAVTLLSRSEWVFLLAVLFIVCVGIVLLGYSLSKRSWMFLRTADEAILTRWTLFGPRTRRWASANIANICLEVAPWEVNDAPYYLVNIVFQNGSREKLLESCQKETLEGPLRLLKLGPKKPVVIRPTSADKESGQCLICGEALGPRPVICAQCRTPHHEECWLYNGQCSTFGCGGIKCIPVGATK